MINRLSLHLHYRLRNLVLHVLRPFQPSHFTSQSSCILTASSAGVTLFSNIWSWNPEVGCHPILIFLRNRCSYPSLCFIILLLFKSYTQGLKAPPLYRALKGPLLEPLWEHSVTCILGPGLVVYPNFLRGTFSKSIRVHI